MPSKPFFSIDVGKFQQSLQLVKRNLDGAADRAIRATQKGMVALAEDILFQSQVKLEPHTKTGKLSASGTVTEPVVTEESIELEVGFNSAHGAQTDLGGTIRPVRAKMLAIPISDEARKYSSPREMGDRLKLVPLNGRLFLVEPTKIRGQFTAKSLKRFHWQLVPEVIQEGIDFFTSTYQERAPEAPRVVGEFVRRALHGKGAQS